MTMDELRGWLAERYPALVLFAVVFGLALVARGERRY